MLLSVTSPSLLLPLSVYLLPQGPVVLFFSWSSGRKAKESPRPPSVNKAFCHVNKDKLFLCLTPKISDSNTCCPLFELKAGLHLHNQCLLPLHLCLHASICVHRHLCELAHRKPCFFLGIIDLTNCQPCFILRK